jgi:hypothetical protein
VWNAMMKTIEVLMVISVLFGAFFATTQLAFLPSPRSISSPNLRELALTTLQTLDVKGELSQITFRSASDPSWSDLQSALSSSLPPNIVYNLTVYDVNTSKDGKTVTYRLVHSISSDEYYSAADSETASYFVTSPNVTYTVTPQKIAKTLYILNCIDANGWWITGYTGQSLASDLRNLLSPYFQTTILVNSTYQLGLLLNKTALRGETVQDAVVINTFGEAVPIPSGYYQTQGYDSIHTSYAKYSYILGQKVNSYNWTWISIVGYPFYYVTNTVTEPFKSTQAWGIYGTIGVGPSGLNAFLQGLDSPPKSYSYIPTNITGKPGDVWLTDDALYCTNYYGIYPSPHQTSTRALPESILSDYSLSCASSSLVFQETVNHYFAGATYSHIASDNKIHGSFTAIGLTRIPDIRITALGLLQFYRPTLYKSEFTASGTSRLVTLQLGQHGGV